MKNYNEVNIKIMSRSSNESFARTALAAFISQLDPTIDEISDIKTAVSEAVTNSIVHGYKDKVGYIFITAKLYDDGKVYVKIRDKGCGIENIEQAMEPLFTSSDTGDRAGMGFSIMEAFMDKIKVKSVVGKGTTVTLQKVLELREFKKQ
ncbi:MAG: anti-sigma F factor [Clostridia bacterium]